MQECPELFRLEATGIQEYPAKVLTWFFSLKSEPQVAPYIMLDVIARLLYHRKFHFNGPPRLSLAWNGRNSLIITLKHPHYCTKIRPLHFAPPGWGYISQFLENIPGPPHALSVTHILHCTQLSQCTLDETKRVPLLYVANFRPQMYIKEVKLNEPWTVLQFLQELYKINSRPDEKLGVRVQSVFTDGAAFGLGLEMLVFFFRISQSMLVNSRHLPQHAYPPVSERPIKGNTDCSVNMYRFVCSNGGYVKSDDFH